MTPGRAYTLSRRLFWIGTAILTIATALNLLGFKLFFMPLTIVWVLIMARSSHWGGWIDGYKAARKIYLHDSASDLERL